MMQNFKVPKSGGWSCYSAPSCALPNGAVGMRSLGGKSGNRGHLGLWQAGNIDSNDFKCRNIRTALLDCQKFCPFRYDMGIPPRVDEASTKRQLSTWLGLGSRMQSDAFGWRGAQELAKEVSRTKGVAVAMEIAAQGLAEGMDMVAGLIWAPTLTLVKWGCGWKAARNFASEQSKRTLLIHIHP